jgi:hypothetical protein
MARCHSCRKWLGIGLFSRWENMDGHSFCRTCAPTYEQQRRQATLDALLQDGGPELVFAIPNVRVADPDKPRGRALLVGDLVFTDKGVCFVQVAKATRADPGWGLMFGLVGAAIATAVATRSHSDAYEDGAKSLHDAAEDFHGFLRMADRVVVLWKQDIRKIKVSAFWGFYMLVGKFRRVFKVDGGAKQFKPQIQAYSETLGIG